MIVGKATSIQIVRNRRLSRGIAEHVIALSIAAPITLADRFDDDIGTIATGLMLGSVAVGVSLVRRSFRHRPNRLLLLRPFSEAAVSDSLNKLTRRTLSFLGFVFTLQDRDLRAGPLDSLARQFANLGGPVWAWLGPIRFAASSRDELRELKASLSSQVRLPWMWLASWRRLFPVATTDSFWQDAVAVLLTAADVVIIDLSELGPGSL